ncbi:MAG: hypothetical protein ING84_10760 [Cytophagales bacterium]|jgi:uncharacterized protein involved in exopolysaccharide biosynthesis|nr:hypothetical protein [Cytophagales bacterium]MCA6369578.1 hypothetical protein [Cytophagales bacterium]MCA6370708.1 hypothetical protein [Cytophagales bacterium]MCA6377110.1 hypothetical protein [Cytophagales bacterium]MCA6383763.1 hypothetical protein [Cytophagales bacterium]
MIENQKQANASSSDEIDLIELLAKVTLGIKNNFRSLVLAFVIGSLLGLAFYQFVPKVYESNMIIQSDILTESYGERIAESMDLLIREQNFEILGSRMGISLEKAASINKIKIESVKQKQTNTTEKENNTFIITVRTTDNTLLPDLQNGLINYLRNNEFVKVRVRQRQDYYKAMIEKVGQEISSLDSLKKRLFTGKPIYSNSAEMMLVDPTTIYSEIIKLSKEQIEYKNGLELVNSIQLVEGFTIYKKPVSPKLSISLTAGASIGVFFVLTLIAIKGLRKIVELSEEKLGKN